MNAPGDGTPPTSAWTFLSLPGPSQQRKSCEGSTPELTSSYVSPRGLESVQWPWEPQPKPWKARRHWTASLCLFYLLSFRLGLEKGRGRVLQLGKERASLSLIKAPLGISLDGPREEGLGFRAGRSTLYQNAIKLIPIMLIITYRIAGTLGRCDSV